MRHKNRKRAPEWGYDDDETDVVVYGLIPCTHTQDLSLSPALRLACTIGWRGLEIRQRGTLDADTNGIALRCA